MSEAKQRAVKAEQELTITSEAHAALREKYTEEAIKLAALGQMEKAYQKLLMVLAVDNVRTAVMMQRDDAVIEEAAAKARTGTAAY